MSDEHKDPSQKTSGPGHEVDSPPTKELFNIVWGLGGLTLLSIATCAQLFYQQERDISAERGKETSYQLVSYRKEMTERATGNGVVEFKDTAGEIIKQRFQPIDAARAEVLSRPEALKAAKPPAGWQHPDDIAAGGQAGAPADGAGTGPAAGMGPPGIGGTPPPNGGMPTPADGTAPVGSLPAPLGEPAQLPTGTGPADPTSAEPIRPTPTEAPPPTPSVPAVNPAPAPAPPVQPAPTPAPAPAH
jgi:hypothetical protein